MTALYQIPNVPQAIATANPAHALTLGSMSLHSGRPQMANLTSTTSARLRATTAIEYRLIYGVAFLYFLALSLVGRLFPPSWRPSLPGTERGLSVFAEARAITGTLIPFAFQR